MSSMIVSFGERSNESSLNYSFGEVMLWLLEVENMNGSELKKWCISHEIKLPQEVWASNLDNEQKLALFKFILCLQFSNEQLESNMEQIFEQRQLLWVDLRIEPWAFDDLYDLHGNSDSDYDNPLTKYALDLYTANLFLRCSALYHNKDFVQHCCASKQKMKSLEDKRETFPEIFDKGKELFVKVPWVFPHRFLEKVTKQHTLKCKVAISFSKLSLKDVSKLYRDINPEDIAPQQVKVDMKWLEGTNRYTLWKSDEEDSLTSLALEEIKQRQIERQKIFEDDSEFLTPRSNFQTFQTLTSSENSGKPVVDIKPTFSVNKRFSQKSDKVTQIDLNEHETPSQQAQTDKENCAFAPEGGEYTTTREIGEEEDRHKMVSGISPFSVLNARNQNISESVDFSYISSPNRLLFVPSALDKTEATCLIKIEINDKSQDFYSSPKSVPLTKLLSKLRILFKKQQVRPTSKDEVKSSVYTVSTESGYSELELPPSDNSLTFKRFFKAKLRQIREDFSYYKKVAIYCIDDIKHYKPEQDEENAATFSAK